MPPDPPPEPGGDAAPGWLPRHRLAIPARPAHYCDRPALTRRCDPLRRAAVVLMAPGGFGKTTLLAEACREAAAGGVPVAWMTLAREDDGAALDACVGFAFGAAGLDLLGRLDAGESALGGPYPRTDLVLRAVAAAGRPCVLALDELENATEPGAVALLNHLLRRAPPNLHVAVACRELPPALDLSAVLPGGEAEIVAAADLRFSGEDTARLFDLKLSRAELAAIEAEAGGWPIALAVWRNGTGARTPDAARVARRVVEGWIDGRFWEACPAEARERILDAGLMDWFDAALLEEVLEQPGALDRLRALPLLDGLIEPVGRPSRGAYRLHPLLREHCAARLRSEQPERWGRLERRLAEAFARRGATVEAMRHARIAGDPELAGRILGEAGGVRWWLTEGAERLDAADRLLTDDVAAGPVLAMTRCVALLLRGRMREARETYAAAPPTRGSAGAEADRLLARGALDVSGCQPMGAVERLALAPRVMRLVALPGTRDVVRAAMAFGLGVQAARRADFASAEGHLKRAARAAEGRSAYVAMAVEAQAGEVAMVRGDVREARRRYGAAQRLARGRFLDDPRGGAYADLLLLELGVERQRVPEGADARRIAAEPCRGDSPLAHFAAAIGVAADLALEADGPDAALAVIEDLSERAEAAGLAALDAYLAAHRVAVLAGAGRGGAAELAWAAAGLPDDAGCLDFAAHGWRVAEALGCARVRLLAAQGDAGAAGRLAAALADAASGLELRRTAMRALALGAALGPSAADRAAAAGAYLALYARTDYARPLARAGRRAAAALERAVEEAPSGTLMDAGERLLATVRDRADPAPRLTGREKAVLRLLAEGAQDKRIAARLGITVRGVRYRIGRVFAKLGVRRRADAVRRARALGLLDRPESG